MSKLLFFVHSLLHFSVVDGLAEVMSVTFFWSHTGDFITSGLYCWRGNGACSEIFFPMICLSISPFSEHAANLGFFCWASLLRFFIFAKSAHLHFYIHHCSSAWLMTCFSSLSIQPNGPWETKFCYSTFDLELTKPMVHQEVIYSSFSGYGSIWKMWLLDE